MGRSPRKTEPGLAYHLINRRVMPRATKQRPYSSPSRAAPRSAISRGDSASPADLA